MTMPTDETRFTKMSSSQEAHVSKAASELLHEGKKMAHELYQDGKNKVCHVHESLKEYSDDLAHKVHKKPITSLLIAGGIGFILSAILRR